MTDILLIKINLQVRFMNKLLDDKNTPQIKIDLETRQLNNLLKNFSFKKSTATREEKDRCFQNLKALQKRLNNIETRRNEE